MVKRLLTALLINVVLLSGCRTVKNVTETETKTDKVETLKTNTETETNKITKIEIPAHLISQILAVKSANRTDTVKIEGDNTNQTITPVKTNSDSSDKVIITTTENTTTKKVEDKKVETETDTETKTVEEKQSWINWNYLWAPVGIVIVILGLLYGRKLIQ